MEAIMGILFELSYPLRTWKQRTEMVGNFTGNNTLPENYLQAYPELTDMMQKVNNKTDTERHRYTMKDVLKAIRAEILLISNRTI